MARRGFSRTVELGSEECFSRTIELGSEESFSRTIELGSEECFSRTLALGSEECFSRTIELGSEESYDICSPCARRSNAKVQALYYCTDCEEILCKTCLEFHASFPGLKEHNVLGKDTVKNWGKKKKRAYVPTEKCSRHDGKFVEMFCGDHDDLCCHVCVSLDHRTCKDMNYIREVATGIAQSLELQEINNHIDQVKSNVEKIKATREQKKATLEKSRKEVLQSMNGFRKRVNQMFDTLEKKAIADLEQLHGESSKHIMADMKTCDNFIAELQQLKHHLEKTSRTDESQLFINMKKCEKKLLEGEQQIQGVASTTKPESFKFAIDQSLERCIANLQSLGKLEVKTSSSDAKVQSVVERLPIRHLRKLGVKVSEEVKVQRVEEQLPIRNIGKLTKEKDTECRVQSSEGPEKATDQTV